MSGLTGCVCGGGGGAVEMLALFVVCQNLTGKGVVPVPQMAF